MPGWSDQAPEFRIRLASDQSRADIWLGDAGAGAPAWTDDLARTADTIARKLLLEREMSVRQVLGVREYRLERDLEWRPVWPSRGSRA